MSEVAVLTSTFSFEKPPKIDKGFRRNGIPVANKAKLARKRHQKRLFKSGKIKTVPYKTLFNKAVTVFQTYIRNRDKECVQGRDNPEEAKRCYGYLTCGHLITRGKRVVLFDKKNSNGQCQGHNGLHRHYPEVYTLWWVGHYGYKAYDDLVEKSKVNYYKHTREELDEIIKKYASKTKD